MVFQKFTILNVKDSLGQEVEEVEMLFNLDHIVSIKPIRISRPDKLLNGFWLRTTNGKKYKATKIPDSLLTQIGEKYSAPIVMTYDIDDEVVPQ